MNTERVVNQVMPSFIEGYISSSSLDVRETTGLPYDYRNAHLSTNGFDISAEPGMASVSLLLTIHRHRVNSGKNT